MVELLEHHVHLALGAETGQRRFAAGAYGFWRAHVRALLTDQDGMRVDPDAAGRFDQAGLLDALVDVLLAPLAPELYQHQRQQRGRSVEEITAALGELAQAVLAGRPPRRAGFADL